MNERRATRHAAFIVFDADGIVTQRFLRAIVAAARRTGDFLEEGNSKDVWPVDAWALTGCYER